MVHLGKSHSATRSQQFHRWFELSLKRWLIWRNEPIQLELFARWLRRRMSIVESLRLQSIPLNFLVLESKHNCLHRKIAHLLSEIIDWWQSPVFILISDSCHLQFYFDLLSIYQYMTYITSVLCISKIGYESIAVSSRLPPSEIVNECETDNLSWLQPIHASWNVVGIIVWHSQVAQTIDWRREHSNQHHLDSRHKTMMKVSRLHYS